jgi:hypothetical protein
MERLLLLHVHVKGAPAEVFLNGFPLVALGPQGGQVCLPVHEYAIAGRNQLAMRVGPDQPPLPMIGEGQIGARVLLALCNKGQSPVDPNARVLTRLEWVSGHNERHEWPQALAQTVELPVSFPRWRWLDAPPIVRDMAIERQALELVQQIALDLQLGNPETLLTVARLRTEELALAYQRSPEAWAQGIRDQIQQRFAAKALDVKPPAPGALVLRPVAEGRLFDCLAADGLPVLRTGKAEDASLSQVFWPLRVAHVNGQFYALR